MVWVHGVSTSASYVLRKAACPRTAAALVAGGIPPAIVQPVFVNGTALPGETPTSPVTTPGAVQVTFVPPRTAKLAAVPSEGACAQARLPILNMQITNTILFISKLLGWISLHRR
jgi:hypothetical protein